MDSITLEITNPGTNAVLLIVAGAILVSLIGFTIDAILSRNFPKSFWADVPVFGFTAVIFSVVLGIILIGNYVTAEQTDVVEGLKTALSEEADLSNVEVSSTFGTTNHTFTASTEDGLYVAGTIFFETGNQYVVVFDNE